MDYILQMENINKRFFSVHAIKDVSLEIIRGETIALVGENGAGKSTLMKILTGSHKKDSGRIRINGTEVNAGNTAAVKKHGIVQIYQQIELCTELTVAENILMGDKSFASYGLVHANRNYDAANALLKEYSIPLDAGMIVKSLSVAMRQLVAIAKALYKNADIIIWDEPTAMLSENEVELLFHIIDMLKKKGKTMIYISHRLEEVFKLSDRIAVMRDGALITVLKNEGLHKDALIEHMLGHSLHTAPPEIKKAASDDVVLELDHVTTHKVKEVSFQLHKGEILGIAGLVGSGRTETVRAIYGLDKVKSGGIKMWGKPVRFRRTKEAKLQGVFFAPEDRKKEALVLCRSIRENISLSNLRSISKIGVCNSKKEESMVEKFCSDLNVKTSSIENAAQNLSGGNQQKVVIAKAIAASPKIIIFDEPTQGIDVGAKAEIYSILEELRATGISIIVISSEMEELQRISDRIIVMHDGSLSGELKNEEISDKELLLKYMYRSV